jgi:solute carrier family 25 protein 16
MATLSSTGSGSTLSKLPSSGHHNLGASSIQQGVASSPVPTESELGNQKDPGSRSTGNKDSTESTVRHESKDGTKQRSSATVRETKSLDYVIRSMIAGGIAGTAVSDHNSWTPLSLDRGEERWILDSSARFVQTHESESVAIGPSG